MFLFIIYKLITIRGPQGQGSQHLTTHSNNGWRHPLPHAILGGKRHRAWRNQAATTGVVQKCIVDFVFRKLTVCLFFQIDVVSC